MQTIRRVFLRFSKAEWLRRAMRLFLTPLDMGLGKLGLAPTQVFMGSPLCYLTTTGRRTGTAHTVPLIYMRVNGGPPTVVATNYGTERHPAWALNLEADPRAELRINKTISPVVARQLTEDEASTVWPLFDAEWPGYERYREITDRPIKVFVLEPAYQR